MNSRAIELSRLIYPVITFEIPFSFTTESAPVTDRDPDSVVIKVLVQLLILIGIKMHGNSGKNVAKFYIKCILYENDITAKF